MKKRSTPKTLCKNSDQPDIGKSKRTPEAPAYCYGCRENACSRFRFDFDSKINCAKLAKTKELLRQMTGKQNDWTLPECIVPMKSEFFNFHFYMHSN